MLAGRPTATARPDWHAIATITIVNADGSSPRDVGQNVAGGPPAWSPDGTTTAYTGRVSARGLDVAVVGADGTPLFHIAEPDRVTLCPVWSPDGKRITFLSMNVQQPIEQQGMEPGRLRLEVAGADGSDPRR